MCAYACVLGMCVGGRGDLVCAYVCVCVCVCVFCLVLVISMHSAQGYWGCLCYKLGGEGDLVS